MNSGKHGKDANPLTYLREFEVLGNYIWAQWIGILNCDIIHLVRRTYEEVSSIGLTLSAEDLKDNSIHNSYQNWRKLGKHF